MSKLGTLILVLVCEVFFEINTLNAQSIKGRILDAETKCPIPNVNVYFDGTSTGSDSDSSGYFHLNRLSTNIPLVFSCIGYETASVPNPNNNFLTILLTKKTTVLRDVVIKASTLSREQMQKMFLLQFIGYGDEENCLVTNKEDLLYTFNNVEKTLTVESRTPLLISNKALGYDVTYYLSEFTCRYSKFNLFFQGNYFFRDRTGNLPTRQLKKVLRARQKAYQGSRMHFIRSLWLNNLTEAGFKVLDDTGKQVLYTDIVSTRGGNKYLSLKGRIEINYNKKKSYLRPKSGINEILIEANGHYDPRIIWSGEMGTQRISKLLPFEFAQTLTQF